MQDNSDEPDESQRSQAGSSGLTKTLTLNVGKITSRAARAAVSGQRLTGRLQLTTRVRPARRPVARW